MKAIAFLLALLVSLSPAFAAAGSVTIQVPDEDDDFHSEGEFVTGEVTQPAPVIAEEPQTEIAVPLVTQQQAEKPDPVIDSIVGFWNHFFGFVWRF